MVCAVYMPHMACVCASSLHTCAFVVCLCVCCDRAALRCVMPCDRLSLSPIDRPKLKYKYVQTFQRPLNPLLSQIIAEELSNEPV